MPHHSSSGGSTLEPFSTTGRVAHHRHTRRPDHRVDPDHHISCLRSHGDARSGSIVTNPPSGLSLHALTILSGLDQLSLPHAFPAWVLDQEYPGRFSTLATWSGIPLDTLMARINRAAHIETWWTLKSWRERERRWQVGSRRVPERPSPHLHPTTSRYPHRRSFAPWTHQSQNFPTLLANHYKVGGTVRELCRWNWATAISGMCQFSMLLALVRERLV